MKLKTIIATVLFVASANIFAQNDKDKKVMADAEKAKMELKEMDGMDRFFNNSSGYVIFPNVGKGGLIVGGASGNGVLYENGMAKGMASLKKVDIGLQAGGQALTEIIFFETQEALNDFKDGNYELSANATAIAIDKGIAANANYKDGVAVFTKPKKGLMADLSIGGQKFEYDEMDDK
ncbi:lipid-binding SYLF domain-containing protein [Maribacter litopenaei]|uniref:Lipid-binding SYLF domain-containing protein n=1 Tax=Maribacter litopenaei TaxID=2976127 RepID=A0ABY5Y5X6_9FLAO|nr:lipid-binding SYLF domain-containing protein [Maribacter litopenaei]UWX54418.1 lipid-binding SYLF domain-containing protein [Maribacter litopenaei]